MTTEPVAPGVFGLAVMPPGGAMFPYDSERAVWETTSRGYSIRVRVEPSAPRAGEVVHFHVEASGPPGSPCCVVFTIGGQRGLDREGRCLLEREFETPYVYNTAGLQQFQVNTDACNSSSEKGGWLTGWLQVSEGKSSVQGPALPTVVETYLRGSDDHPGDRHYLSIDYVLAEDEDGWISALAFDWGDGSPVETFPGDPTPCKAVAPWGWPVHSRFLTIEPVSPGNGDPPHYEGPRTFDHFYENPGVYPVTVTARSTACDGSQLQEGPGTTLEWSVFDKPF